MDGESNKTTNAAQMFSFVNGLFAIIWEISDINYERWILAFVIALLAGQVVLMMLRFTKKKLKMKMKQELNHKLKKSSMKPAKKLSSMDFICAEQKKLNKRLQQLQLESQQLDQQLSQLQQMHSQDSIDAEELLYTLADLEMAQDVNYTWQKYCESISKILTEEALERNENSNTGSYKNTVTKKCN